MIKFFQEIFSESKDIAIERIKSPLLSAFGLSWLIFNWKIILYILLSDNDVEAKIIKIDDLSNLYNGFWFPLLVAVFYAAIYPLVNYLIFMAHHKFEKSAEIRRAENAIEVLEIKVKKVQLESMLEQSKFNSHRRLEEEKIENAYRLESQKLDLEMKRLEMEQKIHVKQKEVENQSK